LSETSGHSADYILFGIDDSRINKTQNFLNKYSDNDIIDALHSIRELSLFIKKN